jgi:exoribonuclease II
MRISPKTYSSHQIQFLEKTQTEAYLEFKSKYPEIIISQRLFENYKPFFVVPVRPKDRCTCCCRQHVEMRCVFKQCMQFRKSILKNKSNVERESYPIFEHISDMVK